MIRTHCVKCGNQIETEVKRYQGKEFLNEDILKKEDIYPDDPYTYVHLLCEKCSMQRGVQNEADKKK
jgi:hypothetical protein